MKFVEARECSCDGLFLKRLERKEAKRKSISWGKNLDQIGKVEISLSSVPSFVNVGLDVNCLNKSK